VFLKSWDRFMVPLPFGTGAFVCAAPIRVLDSADEEEARRALEQALNAAGRQADELVGAAG
jgi:hypothetical protein